MRHVPVRSVLAALAAAALVAAGPLTDIVDTRIGTGGVGFGIGSLNPGAQVPFGSMRLGPDTSLGLGFELLPFNHYGGYYFNDTHVRAFSHTHLVGAGVGDYGNIGVMVTNRSVDDALIKDQNYRSAFSHEGEVAQPAYYAVNLLDTGARAELTATGPFSGAHRYSCGGSGAECTLLVDACHSISKNMTDACRFAELAVEPATTGAAWPAGAPWAVSISGSVVMHGSLSGRSQHGQGVRVFFALNAAPITAPGRAAGPANASLSLWTAGVVRPSSVAARPAFNTTTGSAGAALTVPRSAASGFVVRAGISFVSAELARANAEAEQAGIASFDAAKEAGQAAWEARLGRVTVGAAAPPVDVPGAQPGMDAPPPAITRAAASAELARAELTPAGDELEERRREHLRVAAAVAPAAPAQRRRAAAPADGPAWQSRRRVELYSAVYRSLLAPSVFSESDGRYSSFAGDVRAWQSQAGTGSRYRTDMSLWDIHRSQSAWLTLAAPSDARDVTASLVRMAEDGGRLPRWPLANVYTGCMVASHGVVVMADAVARGTGGVNASAVLALAAATVDAQAAASTYGPKGYVTSEESERGSAITLAYAFDDGTVARLAELAGSAAGDAARARSGNWRNAMTTSPASGPGPFPCPRDASGTFACPGDLLLPYPLETHYVEGDAWNYRWFVPAAPGALVGAFPSPAAFASALDRYMNESLAWPLGGERAFLPNPWYWAGNEPSLLNPFQFVFAGPAYVPRTQFWVRAMTQLAYGTQADGLPGNDDFGTMSAWQAMALLGLYPLAGTPTFVLASPAFQNGTLSLPPAEAASLFGFASLEEACERGGAPGLCSREEDVPVLEVSWDADVAVSGGLYASGATLNGMALPGPLVNQSALLGCVCGCGNAAPRACAESQQGRAASLAGVLADGPSRLVFRSSAAPAPWTDE